MSVRLALLAVSVLINSVDRGTLSLAAVRELYRHYMGRPLHLTDPFDCQLYGASLTALSPGERMDAVAEALRDIRQYENPAVASQAAGRGPVHGQPEHGVRAGAGGLA